MEQFFQMKVQPGHLVFGRQLDFLVFERIDDYPASGWFVAASGAWELPQLCQVVPAANVRPFDGQPRYISESGDPLPADAVPFGRLVRGYIVFGEDETLKGA